MALPVSRRVLVVAAAVALMATGLASPSAPASAEVPPAEGWVLGDFSVFGTGGVQLKQGADILSGHVGVNDVSSSPFLASGSEVTVGLSVVVDPGSIVAGDTVFLKSSADVTDVYANELDGQGSASGTVSSPAVLPLIDVLPTSPTFAPGSTDVFVAQGDSTVLGAGSYGALDVNKGASVTFTGGVYQFEEWDVGLDVDLMFQAPSQVLVSGKIHVDKNSYLGPDPDLPALNPYEIVLWSNGINGSNGNMGATPKAVKLGLSSEIHALIFGLNGTVHLRQNAVFSGQLVGKWIIVGDGASVELRTNQAPIAVGDAASLTTDQGSVVVDVLANDSDPGGDTLTVTAVSDPASGSVTINADSTVSYAPDSGFLGLDSFTYTVSDGELPASAVVSVTVDVALMIDLGVMSDAAVEVSMSDGVFGTATGAPVVSLSDQSGVVSVPVPAGVYDVSVASSDGAVVVLDDFTCDVSGCVQSIFQPVVDDPADAYDAVELLKSSSALAPIWGEVWFDETGMIQIIGLKGDLAANLELLSLSGLDIDSALIDVVEVDYSVDELLAAQQVVLDNADSLVADFNALSVRVDRSDNRLEVESTDSDTSALEAHLATLVESGMLYVIGDAVFEEFEPATEADTYQADPVTEGGVMYSSEDLLVPDSRLGTAPAGWVCSRHDGGTNSNPTPNPSVDGFGCDNRVVAGTRVLSGTPGINFGAGSFGFAMTDPTRR